MSNGILPVSVDAVKAAYCHLQGKVTRTPILSSRFINELAGGREVFFKCENFQQTGVFKLRGAMNAVRNLQGGSTVVTHSSGNHATALACAAKLSGLKSEIVMPSNSPTVKVDNVLYWDGNITFCEPTLQAREETAERIVNESQGHFVHPYNDPDVIAGQGSIGMEFCEQIPDLDAIIVPIGGAGMISGISLAAQAQNRPPIIVAAEPEGANDAFRSKEAGECLPMVGPQTIADGLRTQMGTLTWPIVRDLVHSIHTVSEEEIIDSMKLCMNHLKVVIEPSAGVGPSVLLKQKDLWESLDAKKIGVVLCGGNVDLCDLAKWIS